MILLATPRLPVIAITTDDVVQSQFGKSGLVSYLKSKVSKIEN